MTPWHLQARVDAAIQPGAAHHFMAVRA